LFGALLFYISICDQQLAALPDTQNSKQKQAELFSSLSSLHKHLPPACWAEED
jgi:hypothetical protein